MLSPTASDTSIASPTASTATDKVTAAADEIASVVLATFSALPPKFKPRSKEWVPLSGIVLETAGPLCHSISTSRMLTFMYGVKMGG